MEEQLAAIAAVDAGEKIEPLTNALRILEAAVSQPDENAAE